MGADKMVSEGIIRLMALRYICIFIGSIDEN